MQQTDAIRNEVHTIAPRMWHVSMCRRKYMSYSNSPLLYLIHGKLGNIHGTRLMLVNETWHARTRPSSMARAAGVLLSCPAGRRPRSLVTGQLCRSGDHHRSTKTVRIHRSVHLTYQLFFSHNKTVSADFNTS